ncbi:hypothetical protein MW887_000601 [Aspergillus wentii]|nr:hypothetical protein MW887_000601 [Aspergillus wentii]
MNMNAPAPPPPPPAGRDGKGGGGGPDRGGIKKRNRGLRCPCCKKRGHKENQCHEYRYRLSAGKQYMPQYQERVANRGRGRGRGGRGGRGGGSGGGAHHGQQAPPAPGHQAPEARTPPAENAQEQGNQAPAGPTPDVEDQVLTLLEGMSDDARSRLINRIQLAVLPGREANKESDHAMG